MQAFRLQNFRGFIDTGWIELKPLTLLVGANSTGKSSLLRFLPLLRQSMATETGVPFAWAKEGGVDLGTAQDVHRRGATEPLRVGLKLQTGMRGRATRKHVTLEVLPGIDAEFDVAISDETPAGEVKQFSLLSGRFGAVVDVSRPENSSDGALATSHRWLGPIGFRGGVVPDALQVNRAALARIRSLLNSTSGERNDESEDAADPSESHIWAYQSEVVHAIHLSIPALRKVLEEADVPGREVTVSDAQLAEIQAELWDLTIGSTLGALRTSLFFWSNAIEYIGPARFPPMRYHRMWAERPRRLMPDGANLAVLFGGMSPRDQREFNTFLKETLGYTLSLKSGSGNAELNLANAEGEAFNIADLGFGLSQVLPVYLQAHLARQNPSLSRSAASLFVVEQPELHLHPQLQAKLADLFVGMSAYSKNNPRPVPCFVETHSKALLERTGELVEEGAIRAEDVQVLLFEKDGKDCRVRATTFDEQGLLRDWPVGFLSR